MDLTLTRMAGGACRLNGTIPAVIGRGGTRLLKTEGDGATPVGRFPLRRVLYRPDRVTAPHSGLPVSPIDALDGWCDDPASPDYNTAIRLPHPARHERLWREDGLYDVIVVLGYNDEPPLAPLGSAIFLHCAAPDWSPTEGCVAIAREDLLALLPHLGPAGVIRIPMPDR